MGIGANRATRVAIGGVTGVVASLGGLLGGWGTYSALGIDHAVSLPPAIDAERREFRSATAGRVSYYVANEGAGRPLVLVHSVNAAASAY